MKKIKIMFVVLSVLCILPITGVAAEENTYDIYNGYGELVYVADTLEEAEDYIMDQQDEKSARGFKKICQFSAKKLGVVGVVLTAIDVIFTFTDYLKGEADMIDVIDAIVPISVLERLLVEGNSGILYFNEGFNPYPPHSYQGVMWVKANSYYVIN